MSEDRWSDFRQREIQQRQERVAKDQRIAEEAARKKKEAEHQQILREQARIAAEQRQAEERRVIEQQASERRMHEEEVRRALLAQAAEDLRIANQRMHDAQVEAAQKAKEEQQIKEKGSPIETLFNDAWRKAYPDIALVRQYPIGRFRVDFAHETSMTAIELDGHLYHSEKRDRNRDYQRQQEIEDLGWRFVRFTGTQVYLDIDGCVDLVRRRIR